MGDILHGKSTMLLYYLFAIAFNPVYDEQHTNVRIKDSFFVSSVAEVAASTGPSVIPQ